MGALLSLRGSQMVASFLYHSPCFPGLRGAEGTFLTSQSCSRSHSPCYLKPPQLWNSLYHTIYYLLYLVVSAIQQSRSPLTSFLGFWVPSSHQNPGWFQCMRTHNSNTMTPSSSPLMILCSPHLSWAITAVSVNSAAVGDMTEVLAANN